MNYKIKITSVVIITSLLLFFTSCKKNMKDGPTYTISGHLYEDCNMQPVANTFMDLLYGGSGFLTSTTTDANGYFKLEFKHGYSDFQKIRIKSGTGYSEIMINIPWLTNIDSLVLYKNATTNILVSLNVLNPYTQNDTLVIGDYRNLQNTKFIGPFSSGVLYTAAKFPLLIQHYAGEEKSLNWYFNTYTGSQFNKVFVIDKYCNDTIFVTADIN